jgi:hypothetical protein
MGEQAITKRQDERYVIEHAKLLVHTDAMKDPKGYTQALKDLRTAVAFLEAHGEEEGE